MGGNRQAQGGRSQPELGACRADILEVDGLQFKDLNRNGTLDPYEDWRRPIEERVEDLLSRMNLGEKAGLMVHPALGMGEGGTLLEEPLVFSLGPDIQVVMGPPTTEARAPSIPATTMRQLACLRVSRWEKSRCRPDTPTSQSTSARWPII